MSNEFVRRSTRVRTNRNGLGNGTRINGNRSFNRNPTNSTRASHTNNARKNTNTNSRISGRKRAKPDSPDSSDDSSNESSSTSDSNYENNNNTNTNGHKRRRLTQPSQMSDLNTQTQTTQLRKRRQISYKLQPQKWKAPTAEHLPKANANRRKARIEYRKLAEDTHENRAAIVDPMNPDFIDKLKEQNKIYKNVSHPNEAFMDITQSNAMSIILKEQTRTLANEHFTITPNDYIKALHGQFRIGNNANDSDSDSDDDDNKMKVDWSAIGQRFAPWFLSVPRIQFMNGPLQASIQSESKPVKTRQTRKKRTFTSDAQLIQPKKVMKQKKKDQTETRSRIITLKKTLKKTCNAKGGAGINPFAFLINPDSYSQTVENLFDISFMIKEGQAQMVMDENTAQPQLSFVSSKERTKRKRLHEELLARNKNKGRRGRGKGKDLSESGNSSHGQCIVKFNPRNFCELIEAYGITESQIYRDDGNGEESEEDSSGESKEESDGEQTESENDGSDNESESDNATNVKKKRVVRNGNKRGNNKGKGRAKKKSNDKEEAD